MTKEMMEEAHKAVLKRKRVHDDKILLAPNKIKNHNTTSFYITSI